MKVTAMAGTQDIAMVYLAEMGAGKYIEFVESVQPPVPKEEKWVLILSTLFGCPVGCAICDAGGWYQGKLSKEEILAQVDYLVEKYFPGGTVPVRKFKIQFSRMGEPALNPDVLAVLETLPSRYDAPGLLPSLSTVAPKGSEFFFERLLEIKNQYYSYGRFQLQFSLHSTDSAQRDKWVPVKKWEFNQIASYGRRFYNREQGDRKITLNFALAEDTRLSVPKLLGRFDPAVFMIKITPVNPTVRALQNEIVNEVKGDSPADEPGIAGLLRAAGYDVIVSIGEREENKIGSNCGQYIKRFLETESSRLMDSYEYGLEETKNRG